MEILEEKCNQITEFEQQIQYIQNCKTKIQEDLETAENKVEVKLSEERTIQERVEALTNKLDKLTEQ